MSSDFETVFAEMAAKWPSAVVARKEIKNFTGGLISPKTLANMDSLGQGVEERFMLLNQVVYPINSLGTWMKKYFAKSWKERKRVK